MKQLWTLLVSLLLSCLGVNGMENPVLMEIKPESNCYKVGFPVVFDLNIKNNGSSDLKIELDPENFQIIVEGQGKKTQIPQHVKGGLSSSPLIKIAKGAAYTHKLILDQFTRLPGPGHYAISILITDVSLKAETSVDIMTQLDARLQQFVPTLKARWAEFEKLDKNSDIRQYFESYFSFGRHPEFIEYQIQLLPQIERLDLDIAKNLIAGLLESGEEHALKEIIRIILENKRAPKVRVVALYCLHQMPKDWWDQKKIDLFGKYSGEIKTAAPIEIGD